MALRGTLTHRKTRRLAKELGIPLPCALGLMEALWHVTAEQAPTGAIGKLSDQDLADEMFWEDDASKLVSAFIKSGLIDECKTNRLVVHDWADHADQATKRKVARGDQKIVEAEKPAPVEPKRRATAKQKLAMASHGMDVTGPPESGVRSPEPEPEPEPVSPPPPVLASVVPEVVDEIADLVLHLNALTGVRRDPKAQRQFIEPWIKAGATVADVRLVFDFKHAQWHKSERMRQHICPKTLCRPSHRDEYLSTAVEWDRQGRPSFDESGKPSGSVVDIAAQRLHDQLGPDWQEKIGAVGGVA